MSRPGRVVVFLAVLAACSGCAQLTRGKSIADSRVPFQKPKSQQALEKTASNTPQSKLPDIEAEVAESPHDSATQLLIGTELRDLPAEEQSRWRGYLNSLPTSQVAKALRELHSGSLPGSMADTDSSDAELADHESRPDDPNAVTQSAHQAPEKKRSRFPRIGLPQILPDRTEPSTEKHAAVSPDPDVQPTPEPLPSQEPISPGASLWETEVRKLITLLEADEALAGSDADKEQGYLRREVALRMLHLLANDPEESLRVIPRLPPAEQEFWTHFLWSLQTSLNGSDLDTAERRQQALVELQTAVRQLQLSSPLTVRNLAFCHRIDGFGSYETYPEDIFMPGESVLLYCELQNFDSEPTPDGFYETRISCRVEIVKAGEDLVADQHDFGSTADFCRVQRKDYFQSFRLNLPELTAGEYELRLRMEDEFSGKVAVESVPVTIRN